jgi:serine protease Do
VPKDFNYNYNYKFKMPPMPDMGDMQFDGIWGPRQPKLGIKAQDAEDGKGVNVIEVEDSSAAWKAGLKKGDIILQFDGSEVNSTNELVEQFQEARKKSTIKVRIQRGGNPQDIEIKIPRKLKTAEL